MKKSKSHTNIKQQEISKWKRYCSKCGEEMKISPKWEFDRLNGKKHIYEASYICPNKHHWLDGHDKDTCTNKYSGPADLFTDG